MLEFPQHRAADEPLYAEDTDAPLPEKLNPRTRYAYFSTIATGGKSLIKSCKDLHLRRTICYKSLRPEFVNDPIENRRLLREARISAGLQHPNIVPTYEIGRDNRGHYYFTMKLVHGYTLREVFNYRERYDLTQLVDVLVQVAHALGYAHHKGVLHRDIKPENILIGRYGEVLLLDWGLAKVWHREAPGEGDMSVDDETESASVPDIGIDMTGKGKLQGTVMYMSPEQIDRDTDISYASDIYSLGALLYEALTGQTPFQGDIVQVLLQQVRTETPADPRSVSRLHVPDILARLAMDCLQKDPLRRPGSAEDVVRILRENWQND
ncbi:serine/threonine protein kinase [Mangrovimicrobium sediminis]|uniref:Serine/threonine protein kinase n=1 Tax=Mangrovimicrobium sediminis TaxID=2562682 RepID=A0A4Z0LZI5_9GAMM|nr:serine/threonine-protein kinase [Haliea sp. SAOS-164]TGD72644.1 serine/threonine protein kinase [Haliea sp. SAOS-164]